MELTQELRTIFIETAQELKDSTYAVVIPPGR